MLNKKNKANVFCNRINRLLRFSNFKIIPKRMALIEEFNAVDCSFDNTKYRVEHTMVEFNRKLGKFEVRI